MITQKIDRNDDIFGVYHEWAREIAKSFDTLSVICLYEGRNELPETIRVFSLGKEKGWSRAQYVKNFFTYIWRLRNEYDTVFVHMNPVYVLLGWLVWRLMGKKIFLWFAHPAWNWKVKFAYILSDRVVTSVPEAFHIQGGKVIVVGQGIDSSHFRRREGISRDADCILSLGRISPAKRIHILLGAIQLLKERKMHPLDVHIVGDPPQASSKRYLRSIQEAENPETYFRRIQEFVGSNDLEKIVRFHKSVPNIEAYSWYNRCGIFVNLSPTGYFDKTVLEAMACECLPIVSNEAYRHVFPKHLHNLLLFQQDDARDLAEKIKKVMTLSQEERNYIGKSLRDIVVNNHSLSTLGSRLRKAMSVSS